METEVTTRKEKSADLVKHENKIRWISEILMKRIQGLPLNNDDHKFIINMQLSDDNEEYAKLIKADIEVAQAVIDEKKEVLDAEAYIKALQSNISLKTNIYRNIKQGHRDDAVTNKMNLDMINKFSKIAREQGIDFESKNFAKFKENLEKHKVSIKKAEDQNDS